MYFASHRSGVREILYKAQLYNIAYSIEAVPGYNMIGYDLIYGNTMDDDEEYDEDKMKALDEYLEEYAKRKAYPVFPCSRAEYYQMTIFDCFPEEMKEVSGCA